MSSFYVTAAIPYVNAKPHLGHVLEWFQADAIARYRRQLGDDVAFTSGTDENSLKNVLAAEKAGLTPQAWLDEYAHIFEEAFAFFDISLTEFRRSSDQTLHWPGVQELWRRCQASGDLYTKIYEGLYCVGCESYYTPEELIKGKCPEHFTVPELVKEENYFFKLSKYQAQIQSLIETDQLRIVSSQFKKEMLSFVSSGLDDFSVSRSISRGRGVGVPVPNDPTQVMYVWFDALSVYLTAIGWDFNQLKWQQFWPANVHVVGKGINRFHSVYWIGMLLSAGLEVPKAISVHGYLTADGQKMSKSLGNVIDPFEVVSDYGLEPIRYYLLKEIPTHSDGDFSLEKFKQTYTADLANGLGNLCSRVAKLAEKTSLPGCPPASEFDSDFERVINEFELDIALKLVQQWVANTDLYLSEQKPWILEGVAQTIVLAKAVVEIQKIAYHLQPFMPQTAQHISAHFSATQITAMRPLFPRLPL